MLFVALKLNLHYAIKVASRDCLRYATCAEQFIKNRGDKNHHKKARRIGWTDSTFFLNRRLYHSMWNYIGMVTTYFTFLNNWNNMIFYKSYQHVFVFMYNIILKVFVWRAIATTTIKLYIKIYLYVQGNQNNVNKNKIISADGMYN